MAMLRSLRSMPVGRACRSALLVAGMLGAGSASALEAGAQAPGFELPGVQGAVSLAQAQGKVVYLDFWASWCGPCRKSFPWMNETQAKYKERGLQVIAVNLDSDSRDAQGFLAKNPAQFTVAFDPAGKLPVQYGVQGMPSSFLIGRDGKVLMQHKGFNDTSRVELEQRIAAALGDAP